MRPILRIGQLVRTYYDAQTGQSLGAFPVVPGQAVQLNDGRTTVSYGLPPSTVTGDDTASQPAGDIRTVEDLRRAQAQLSDLRQGMDPIGSAYRAIDGLAHQIQIPRVGDYMTPSGGADPNTAAIQTAFLNAYVPDARGTHPATADDFISPVTALFAPAADLSVALEASEPTLEGLEALLGRTPSLRFEYRTPPLGLPTSQAEMRGIPRFNPAIYAHRVGADAEERLAHVVQDLPDEQVVRWGDPIGVHGSDVISVNRRTGDVTFWDAKYHGTDTRITHSNTFRMGSASRGNASREAARSIKADTTLGDETRQTALDNLAKGRFKTRTVGYGRALNSTIGH